jgi:N-terminal half of MaoC dehydratase
MALDPTLAGRSFGPTAPFTVSREKIREFDRAIGAEPLDSGATAQLTFPIVVAFEALQLLLTDASVGMQLHNVVHGAQRFEQARPLRVGDEVQATLTVDSVRSAAGVDIVSTSTEVVTVGGELACTAAATLMHRSAAQ